MTATLEVDNPPATPPAPTGQRGLVPGLGTPHPLIALLPGLYQDDDFTRRFLAAFDDMLAPVHSTIDNLVGYLDPSIAPDDFVEWLGSWVGAVLDETWSLERQRSLVSETVELYRWRGTFHGLWAQVAMATGVVPDIIESGGVSWSASPNGPLPGGEAPLVVIRIQVPDPATIELRRLETVILAAKPAHVPHRVEVVQGPSTLWEQGAGAQPSIPRPRASAPRPGLGGDTAAPPRRPARGLPVTDPGPVAPPPADPPAPAAPPGPPEPGPVAAAETTPAETTPAESTAVETSPAETTPAEPPAGDVPPDQPPSDPARADSEDHPDGPTDT